MSRFDGALAPLSEKAVPSNFEGSATKRIFHSGRPELRQPPKAGFHAFWHFQMDSHVGMVRAERYSAVTCESQI
jgi:hypothetical protein